MKLRSLRGVFVFSLSLLPACPAAAAAELQAVSDHGTRHHCDNVFPFLTRIRDTAIEWVFGRKSSRPKAAAYDPYLASQFDEQTVVRFNVSTPDEEAALRAAVDRYFLDVWAFNNHTGFVDVRLKKERVPHVLNRLPPSMQRSFVTLIPDLAASVWATYPNTPSTFDSLARAHDGASKWGFGNGGKLEVGASEAFFEDYQQLAVITRWMVLLEAMFPFACMVNIGKSAEGRDIMGLRLGMGCKERGETTSHRKTILITGGIHGREWISTSTVAYAAWSFISTYGKEKIPTNILDKLDLVFVPVLNPDGYEYTWSTNRLWRKTRQETGMEWCTGLDLDHAFGFEWDNWSPEPCSETYSGKEAFQAVEARALSDWAKKERTEHGVEFLAFLDLHSYSQQIMYPFSYTCELEPPNLENMEEVAFLIAKGIRMSSREYYSITSACEGIVSRELRGSHPRIESGGGSAIDWFHHDIGTKYSYQIKLRDTGAYGFLLPKEQIVPTGEEMFSAMKYMGDYLLGNNGVEIHAGAAEGDKDVDESNHMPASDLMIHDDLSDELKKRRRKR